MAEPADDGMALSRANVEAARSDKSGRVYRVYADGCFDLFHVGHALMFKQIKHLLNSPATTHVIAGVCSDELIAANKGKTVLDHKTRCASVENCKWVDEVAPDAPWTITEEFLERYKIDFVAHDAIPYAAAGTDDVYAFVKRKGMFLETQRTEGISTSDIIMQIVRDYDSYVVRQVKRGYTPEQLNLGPVWKLKLAEKKKREDLNAAINRTKDGLHEVEDATVSFWLWFPFHSTFRMTDTRTVAQYTRRLSNEVGPRTKGVMHALKLLFRAVWHDVVVAGNYVNAFSYITNPTARRFAYAFAAIAAVSVVLRSLPAFRSRFL